MPHGRKKLPFSHKQKKQQLQARRERKNHEFVEDEQRSLLAVAANADDIKVDVAKERHSALGVQTKSSGRYQLKFHGENKETLRKIEQELSKKSVKILPEDASELPFDAKWIEIPKRPGWDYHISKEKLDSKEHKYFREYVRSIENRDDFDDVGLFELNLETWRQLWRVLEMSDIILLITDARHPSLHFPAGLYNHVKEDLRKDIVVILNKIDLVLPSVVVAWKCYFKEIYPDIRVIYFSSYCSPGDDNKGKLGKRNKVKRRYDVNEIKQLLRVCQEIAGDKIDFQTWEKKIDFDAENFFSEEKNEVNVTVDHSTDDIWKEREKFKDGILTLGFVGFPNVGKSSLLNTLIGHKVVSVSRTPGHTKYFQTIFLTKNIKLCDCPGLVFPSFTPRPLQVLTGSYPISQLGNPYSSVLYLAERIDVVKTLKLTDSELGIDPDNREYSVYDICQAWSIKRGFFTAKAARPDMYRAANHILRLAHAGRIYSCFYPPRFIRDKAKWEKDEEVASLTSNGNETNHDESDDGISSDDSSLSDAESTSVDAIYDDNFFSVLQCDD